MGKINVNVDELFNICCLSLFDWLLHDEVFEGNEEIKRFIEDMNNAGMRSKLLSYFFRVDPQLRGKYKQFLQKTVLKTDKTSSAYMQVMNTIKEFN